MSQYCYPVTKGGRSNFFLRSNSTFLIIGINLHQMKRIPWQIRSHTKILLRQQHAKVCKQSRKRHLRLTHVTGDNVTKADRTPFVRSFNPALPKISSVVKKHITILQSSTNCKKAFPHPPVIAYKRNASLRDLLVHSELPENKPSDQQPTGIHKCNHPRCLTCSFLQEGQTSYTFFTTKETREISNCISCHSKNLIYLIQCKKCHCQYIGETKRQLNERFGEHRRSILNHHQLSNPTPVSALHFNQPGHSVNDVHFIPLELMRSTRDSVRKAREAHLINKAKTLHPLHINRHDEAHQ